MGEMIYLSLLIQFINNLEKRDKDDKKNIAKQNCKCNKREFQRDFEQTILRYR